MQSNRKEELKAVFNDTMLQIQVNDKLTQATRSSVVNTKYYAPDDYPVINHDERSQTKIAVTRSKHHLRRRAQASQNVSR